MKNFLIKLFKLIKKAFDGDSNHLKLKSIVECNQTIYCEFNEILRLDGKLIKFDIKEVASNRNIQKSIPSETLFIIGVIYGKFQQRLNEFRITAIDIQNKTVLLENSEEKIKVTINDLIQDEGLIRQINNEDLFRMLGPYFYKLGYSIHENINELESREVFQSHMSSKSNNIVNLF